MEEGVDDRKDNNNEGNDEEKKTNETTDSESITTSEGKRVIYERSRKDFGLNDLVSSFDASNCSGDNFYDIFGNEEQIITEGSIVWLNTNNTIW